jgi:hypothetical protein
MAGWLVGIVASTVLVTFLSRLVDRLVTRGIESAGLERETKPPHAQGPSHEHSWDVTLMRGVGVVLLLLLMVGQAIAGPIILHRFGSDASYQSAVGSLGRSIVFLAPLATIAGFLIERLSRNSASRGRWVTILLLLAALVAIGEVSYRYMDAGDNKPTRLWIDNGQGR